jgi:hypothetical protein
LFVIEECGQKLGQSLQEVREVLPYIPERIKKKFGLDFGEF